MRPAIAIRTLRHEFRLVPPDEAAEGHLSFIRTAPEMPDTELLPVELPVRSRFGFYLLLLPDGREVAGSAGHLLSELNGLVLQDTLETNPGSPLLHGATVRGEWGRAVLLGRNGSGRTTLCLHLLASGYDVEGDEHLVVGQDFVIARPRRLLVRRGSLQLVPALSDLVRSCPSITTLQGLQIHAFDPSLAGLPWRIERGRLDQLVFLEPNHGGRSLANPIKPNEAFRRLVQHASLRSGSSVAAAVGRIRAIAVSTPAFRLSLGDLEGALWHLRMMPKLEAQSSVLLNRCAPSVN